MNEYADTFRNEVAYAAAALTDVVFQDRVWGDHQLSRVGYVYDFDDPFKVLLDEMPEALEGPVFPVAIHLRV